MAIYGVWNAINDVIAGYISDKTRTKWGRRIPYISIFSPIMILLFAMIWSPPTKGKPLSNPFDPCIFLFFLLVIFIFEFVYTLVDVGWNALFPEMYKDIKDRSEVAVYRQIFAIIGVIITIIFTPQLISHFTKNFGTFQGWILVGIILGLMGGASFILSLLGSKEKEKISIESTLPIKEYFKITFMNKSFLTAAFLILTTSWIWSVLEAMIPFIVQYFLGGQVSDITIVGAPMIVFPILFYPIWRKICIRYGSRITLAFSTILMVSGLLVLALWADTIIKAIILIAFFGAVNSGVQLTRELLIPDVIDEDEVRTGLRREGIYYGARTFIDRFALALTGVSTAFIFKLSGYMPGIVQPSEVILSMRIGLALVIIIALTLFLVAIKYYPLGRRKI